MIRRRAPGPYEDLGKGNSRSGHDIVLTSSV